MIARNPKNHEDKWLIAEQYVKDNLERIPFQIGDTYPINGQNMEVIQNLEGFITFAGVDDTSARFQMPYAELMERGYQNQLIIK